MQRGAQTAMASEIFNAKADYVLALKANHPKLHAQVKGWFDQQLIQGFEGITYNYDERVEKGHHRTEKGSRREAATRKTTNMDNNYMLTILAAYFSHQNEDAFKPY
jgi:hypothetical protein